MQKLHVVGFTTDHRSLILSPRRGARSGGYVLEVDGAVLEAVQAALDGGDAVEESAPAETPEPEPLRVESALSVRDVQARLRAGRSVEAVADEAGVDAAWVARFAVPVMAELSRVVASARRASFARPRLGPSALPLGDSVYRNLVDRGLTASTDELDRAWSARQVADGRWRVSLRYRLRGRAREGAWEFDARTNDLRAVDRSSGQLAFRADVPPPVVAPFRAGRRAAVGPVRPSPPVPPPSPGEAASTRRVAAARRDAEARLAEAARIGALRANAASRRAAATRAAAPPPTAPLAHPPPVRPPPVMAATAPTADGATPAPDADDDGPGAPEDTGAPATTHPGPVTDPPGSPSEADPPSQRAGGRRDEPGRSTPRWRWGPSDPKDDEASWPGDDPDEPALFAGIDEPTVHPPEAPDSPGDTVPDEGRSSAAGGDEREDGPASAADDRPPVDAPARARLEAVLGAMGGPRPAPVPPAAPSAPGGDESTAKRRRGPLVAVRKPAPRPPVGAQPGARPSADRAAPAARPAAEARPDPGAARDAPPDRPAPSRGRRLAPISGAAPRVARAPIVADVVDRRAGSSSSDGDEPPAPVPPGPERRLTRATKASDADLRGSRRRSRSTDDDVPPAPTPAPPRSPAPKRTPAPAPAPEADAVVLAKPISGSVPVFRRDLVSSAAGGRPAARPPKPAVNGAVADAPAGPALRDARPAARATAPVAAGPDDGPAAPSTPSPPRRRTRPLQADG
ncbi:MAG: septation protein SepH [Acidimicrobiales bacterium]